MLDSNLLSLLHLTDSTLPIGGYAHSSGLETYVQQGIIKDLKTAKAFVTEMLSQNIQYTDAAFVSLAFDAAEQNDLVKILELDDECTAVKLPEETRQASQKLGKRLIKIFQPICQNRFSCAYELSIFEGKAKGHFCIAFGIYAHALKIVKEQALTGFYYNTAAAMVTNCVKLIPLGQQDGQKLLYSLQPLINKLVKNSLQPDKDLIGLCCTGFDIRCMQHEQLYSRMYMS